MIVDSSALVAIALEEPEAARFSSAIRSAEKPEMSAASYVETGVVVDAYGDPVLSRQLDQLITTLGIRIVELSPGQAGIARKAYADFGKGTGHPAKLNLGDVLSYALAIDTRSERLFKGSDFGETDVRVHPASVRQ